MAFYLKSFTQIVNSIVSSLRVQESALAGTPKYPGDLSLGSRMSAFVGGISAAIAEGYISLAEIRRIFYVATSSGSDLDRRLFDFGMTRNVGFPATGNVIISNIGDVILSPGTVLTTLDGALSYTLANGVSYTYESPVLTGSVKTQSITDITLSGLQTIGSVELFAGDRVLVSGQTITSQNGIYVVSTGSWTKVSPLSYTTEQVIATEVGSKFNLPAGTELKLQGVNFYPNIKIIVGRYLTAAGQPQEPVSGGVNFESDTDLRARFPEFLKSLSRGTLFAVKQALLDIPGISTTNLAIQNAVPAPGWFTINILNAGSEIPNSLRLTIADKLTEWAAAGFGYRIKAIKQVTTKVQLIVYTSNPNVAGIKVQVENAIIAALSGVLTFGKTLYPSQIIAAAKNVTDVINVEVVTPTAAIVPGEDAIIVLESGKPLVVVVYAP